MDGVIAGVGSVLVFIPQIALLFLFIAILEDCGYMARASYLIDRAMSGLGLSGRSFLPLMSSFACAVPMPALTYTWSGSEERWARSSKTYAANQLRSPHRSGAGRVRHRGPEGAGLDHTPRRRVGRRE